jgi:hypothetical protein
VRTIFWLCALVITGLLGYLLHNFIEHRKAQVEILDPNVGIETITLYQARADSLRARADSVRLRLEGAGLLSRPSVRANLALLEDEIVALERTIEVWQKSKKVRSEVDLHRQCVLLYGKASGVCDALASDTITGE